MSFLVLRSPRAARLRPARLAAARVSRASLALGAFGLASSVLIIARLGEVWRIGPHGPVHHVTIFGARFGYPEANAGAIVIVSLALLALIAIALCAAGAVGEAVASARFARSLRRHCRARPDGVLLIEDERPLAFCAGLLRPRIYLSTAAVGQLDAPALRAVLDHERHHARRHDPLRLAAGRVLARALFFLPGLAELARHQAAMSELGADESAVSVAPESRSGLARAMLSFDRAAAPGSRAGFDPARVDYLLGEPPSWRFPVLLCLVVGSAIALLVAVAVLVGRAAHGSATLAPPALSSQPCIVVLALIPAVAAGVYASAARIAAANRSTSSSVVSHEHIHRTSLRRSSQT
jgi:bla regulator protein blaR1